MFTRPAKTIRTFVSYSTAAANLNTMNYGAVLISWFHAVGLAIGLVPSVHIHNFGLFHDFGEPWAGGFN